KTPAPEWSSARRKASNSSRGGERQSGGHPFWLGEHNRPARKSQTRQNEFSRRIPGLVRKGGERIPLVTQPVPYVLKCSIPLRRSASPTSGRFLPERVWVRNARIERQKPR